MNAIKTLHILVYTVNPIAEKSIDGDYCCILHIYNYTERIKNLPDLATARTPL